MEVIAHRGWWLAPAEKNSETALRRAFEAGFGVETDLRDLAGEVVVSHDPPLPGAMPLADLLALHGACGGVSTLALNVKADGLVPLLGRTQALSATSHFFFDMSVPDLLSYERAGLPFYTRQSELEPDPVLLDRACGVWLDAFHSDWAASDDVRRLLDQGLRVCLVSPELHGREHRKFWDEVVAPSAPSDRLLLCTDYPQDAQEAFA